jgi:oxygen-independent coproporphyrinogen-3 oxidase
MMSLRLAEGMDEARYERLAGRPLDERAVQNLIDLGMIARENGKIVVQDQGFMILNAVLAELLVA